MKHAFKIISAILLLQITACQYDPYAGDLTIKKPLISDIIGIYRFKEQTVYDSPINKLAYSATITLKSDGTFEAKNVPDLMDNSKSKLSEMPLISVKGKWEMTIVGGVDNGFGAKDNWGVQLTSMPESLSSIGFTGDGPPYGLIVTYDDPDLGQMMKFQKR